MTTDGKREMYYLCFSIHDINHMTVSALQDGTTWLLYNGNVTVQRRIVVRVAEETGKGEQYNVRKNMK